MTPISPSRNVSSEYNQCTRFPGGRHHQSVVLTVRPGTTDEDDFADPRLLIHNGTY